MGKLKFQVVIFCIPLLTLFFACSNNNQKTLSDDNNTGQAENMTDSEQANLFIIESDSLNRSWKTGDEGNSRQRTADINPSFISTDSSGVGEEFIFNIYDEESLVGEISRVSTDINSLKSISGLLHEDEGSFVFTVTDDRLFGQLRLTGSDKIIQIRFDEELNEYVLTELSRTDLDAIPGSAPMRRENN